MGTKSAFLLPLTHTAVVVVVVLQVTVVACDKMNAMNPREAIRSVVGKNGLSSLFDGVLPMAMRRSLDWGIRFSVSNSVKNRMIRYKVERGESGEMRPHELIFCGLCGGAASALTFPIDSLTTNSQRPLPSGTPRDLVSVIRRVHAESGVSGFTRGWTAKVFENSFHMAWMYGVGTVVYDRLKKRMAEV